VYSSGQGSGKYTRLAKEVVRVLIWQETVVTSQPATGHDTLRAQYDSSAGTGIRLQEEPQRGKGVLSFPQNIKIGSGTKPNTKLLPGLLSRT
jgi:hypothetical protein